jgi:hypothetical protein
VPCWGVSLGSPSSAWSGQISLVSRVALCNNPTA